VHRGIGSFWRRSDWRTGRRWYDVHGNDLRADIDTGLLHLGYLRRRGGLDCLRSAKYYRAGQCPPRILDGFTDAHGCGAFDIERPASLSAQLERLLSSPRDGLEAPSDGFPGIVC
jgi:hypothetical protein